ncbi:eukaryotic aspartyl protease [Pseudomassariella vexata]|uniref:Eukaryotic aspartyl protease n=1 Tax=Pseudomassariella vexata TaxID=1141098 RepID=A0A1Y2DQR3_9PEZI|nr:eukaryotic aspartyl protease [Pseudomassariella vexata]ORY61643.1 eukaryotic aspartyl protease [Pseudomassariella vexata]
MPSLSNSIALAVGLCGLATAAPAIDSRSGDFSVEQVRNPGYVRNGPAALAKAYLKYGQPLPEGLAATIANLTLSKRATGSATTTPEEYDIEYLTPVQIGTPAQTLNLDFDSGSSDLWVFSSLTPTSQRNGQSIYTPGSSSTAKTVSGGTWSISYGDGSSSSGSIYTDKVTVGGLSYASQAVETAKKVSSSFTEDSNNDGLLGLAFSTINTASPRQKTFFDNVKSTLTSPVWTADLKAGKPGKYNFGYIDTAAYTGAITYTAVDSSDGFWEFTSSGYAVGSGAFSSTKITGIADTGTTLALLPSAVVTAYYRQVSGAVNSNSAGGYIFPCSATLPDFTYGVGTARIVIPGSYINYAPYSGSQCYGGIQSNAGIGFSIFGDVALKAAFVVFDSTPRLGFAKKAL